jgi:hypothetical protein
MPDHRRRRRAAIALAVAFTLVGAACSRSDGDTETSGDTTAPAGDTTAAPGGASTVPPAGGLDAGGFGSLEDVCQEGDAVGATDVGVTDDTIQVGTVTDKGFASRPGLNEEMYDAAVAFAAWCNDHGGIIGRQLVVADRDAALGEYNARIIDACSQDFAMVGGGAVLDDADNGGRVACGLPNIAGYVVSATARAADLQVQPVPNAPGRIAFGAHQRIAEELPDLIDGYGVLTSSFGSVLNVRDETVAAAEASGYTVVYSEEYAPTGESNWRPFVEAMQSAGVEIFELIGEPTYFAQILEAMEQVGYRPQVILQQSNFYDQQYRETAGDISENVLVRLAYTPLELADQNPATADYLAMMERYNPGGKPALLGMQATSAYLLFARSAAACGSDLTRACLLEQARSVTDWDAGGLHAPTNPSAGTPSQCFVLLTVTEDAFTVNEELTAATDGIFNCEDDNVVDVAG